jgi:hypothetical protein
MTTEDLPNGQPIASYEMLRDAVAATTAFLARREGPVHPSRIVTLLQSALDSAQLQYDQDRAQWEQDRADKAATVRVYENTSRKVEQLQVESARLRNQLYAKGVELDSMMGKLDLLRQACEETKDVLSAIADSAMAGMGLKLKWADQARRNLEDALEKNAETNE